MFGNQQVETIKFVFSEIMYIIFFAICIKRYACRQPKVPHLTSNTEII